MVHFTAHPLHPEPIELLRDKDEHLIALKHLKRDNGILLSETVRQGDRARAAIARLHHVIARLQETVSDWDRAVERPFLDGALDPFGAALPLLDEWSTWEGWHTELMAEHRLIVVNLRAAHDLQGRVRQQGVLIHDSCFQVTASWNRALLTLASTSTWNELKTDVEMRIGAFRRSAEQFRLEIQQLASSLARREEIIEALVAVPDPMFGRDPRESSTL